MFSNRVIVFGNNHHNTLGLIRSLGEAGINPIVLLYGCDGNAFVAKSKYIGKLHITKTLEESFQILINDLSRFPEKSIVFYPNDVVAKLFDSHYDELKDSFLFQNAGCTNGLLNCFDKSYLYAKASEWGFAIPQTISHHKNDPIPEDITFPCIIKPQSSLHGKKSDIHICSNILELKNSISNLSATCDNYLIQQYIDKEIEVSVLGVSLKREILIPGMINKTREYPQKKGSSSFACLRDFPEDFDITPIITAIRDVKYIGLFSVEFVRKNGKYYFMEINFRNDGNGYVITSAGMNQPYLFCMDILGLPYSYDKRSIKHPFYFMSNSDVEHIAEKRLNLWSWFKDYRKVNCFLQYSAKDPKPTHGKRNLRVALIKAIVKRIIRK